MEDDVTVLTYPHGNMAMLNDGKVYVGYDMKAVPKEYKEQVESTLFQVMMISAWEGWEVVTDEDGIRFYRLDAFREAMPRMGVHDKIERTVREEAIRLDMMEKAAAKVGGA